MANIKINGITYSGIDSIKIPNASGSGQTTFSIPPATQTKTVTPSTTEQTVIPDSGKLLSAVVVAAIPEGSVDAPSTSKGNVNNHSITITPSVSYTTGYITGGSKSGISTTVSVSELVSGSRSITSNGNNIDVTNYKYVNVNVSEGEGGITPTGTINITSAGDTDVTTYATAHVDGGSVSSPTASKSSVSNYSVTVTPSVSYSEGYIENGSKAGTGVSVSASELVSGTRSITGNGTGIDVMNYKYVDVNVSSGEGGVPDPIVAGDTPIWVDMNSHVNNTSSGSTATSYSVKKAGAYRIKASVFASSKTASAQIQVNGTEISAATWSGAGSLNHDDLVVDRALSVGDVVSVFIRGGSATRYAYCSAFALCVEWSTGLN